uniref:Thiol:disulfide interchange protein n=1 Tax=Gracilaria salicornia TaxID=172968 RepID=W8DX61_9FLOR|nr:thiol:disulfide interchange protein [Gracilaria salicornia]AHH24509.1 thiol:disulfide interchange protein [Gracilaria salicornia]UAD87515.1 thiol:disulfide interchange protein [Gracilaria salicornia]
MIQIHFLNMINYQTYNIEQYLYNMLAAQINNAHPIIFILIITSGLLTSLNPCLLSIIPTSLSYIYAEKLTNTSKKIFIFGILSSNIFSIIIFQVLHKQYDYLLHAFPFLSYIITAIISLNLLQILEVNNNFNYKNTRYKRLLFTPLLYKYITGLIIGIGSSSCTAPILLIILFWISSCKSWFLGIVYTTTYLFSCTLPIYLIINQNITSASINKWPLIWNNITFLSGCIMLGYSIFSLLNIIFI